MTFKIAHYENESIILATMGDDFSVKADLPESIRQVGNILDGTKTPHSFIIDATKLKMKFGDMVIRGENPIVKHPNVKELVVVTASDLIELVSEAYGQLQYDSLNVRVFDSLEDALVHTCEQV